MRRLLLDPAEALALALQNALPAQARGLVALPLARLAEAPPGAAVQLVLPQDLGLRQRLELPQGMDRPTPAWVSARIEALSPWEPGAFLWQLRRLGAGAVDLALIPLHPVAEAEAALEARGARLAEVVAPPFVLRRDARQRRAWRDRLALAAVLLALAGLALAGLGGALALQAMSRQALAEDSLARSTARFQAGAAPAKAALALVGRKQLSLAQALAGLAAALPQDSYLTALTVAGAEFDLTGRTARPEAIIPALSAAPGFAGVDFAGPALRDAESGSYSFTIHGQWEGR